MAETIVGIATARGEGGIAIIRISGDDAVGLFEKVFTAAGKNPPYESHRLMYGHVMDGDMLIDEAMGVVMHAPRTYTREDVCELHTHGGDIAAALTMKLLIRHGARPAEAGEFTRRAFMNGRLDLSQAEAVMGVISAQSAAALKAEQLQLSGGQSQFILEAQKDLTMLLSGLEAHIDYPDEIDEDEALEGLESGLASLISRLEGSIDEKSARILRQGLRVALLGRPNAGKSTLFNALLGEERAIVTNIPGTTRDVLEDRFTLDGVNILLSDTAGLRESEDVVEKIGVERAMKTLHQADAALLLVDAGQPIQNEDIELFHMEMPCPCAVLMSKQDTQVVFSAEDAEKLGAKGPFIPVSAKTGEGLEAVRDFLRQFIGKPEQLQLTQERHMLLAREALEKLHQAKETLACDAPLDMAAIDMHEALYILGRITGESVDEKLLDDIFSRFCVGK